MTKVVFNKFPGSEGEIRELGRELAVSGSPAILAKIRKECTIKDRGVEWNLKRARTSKVNLREKLAAIPADDPDFQPARLKLEEKISSLEGEIKELEPLVMKEYWADKADGRLSMPPGFWWMADKIQGDRHLNHEFGVAELPTVDGKRPRDYQVEAATELLRHYRASCVLPTGTGKTLLTALLAVSMIKASKRVCVVEPTIELVNQTVKALRPYCENISGLGGDHKYRLGCDLLVTTIDSALKHIDNFDGIIVDEFHHSAASTYNDTLLLAGQARFFYGLTACPVRADGLSLGIHAACGPVVFERDTRWAIAHKHLVDAKVGMIQVLGTPRFRDGMNAQRVYGAHMASPATCQVIYDNLSKGIAMGKPALVLFKTVGAGESFRDFCMTRYGLKFSVASSEFRKPLIDFREGRTQFLVSNAPLCGEGVDIPNISLVINATQGSSENGVRQIIGRGLRLAPNKPFLTCLDITTTGYKQFEGAYYARQRIYATITDNIKEVVR